MKLLFALEEGASTIRCAQDDAGSTLLEITVDGETLGIRLAPGQACEFGLALCAANLEEVEQQGERLEELVAMKLAASLLVKTALRALLEVMPAELVS